MFSIHRGLQAKLSLHVEEVIYGHRWPEVSATGNESENQQRGTSKRQILEEVDHLTLLRLCIFYGPEVMHHESGRDQEDRKEQRTEIGVDAERDEEPAEQDHESSQEHHQLRSWDLLELRIATHGISLGEMREARVDEEQREEHSPDYEDDIHGSP